MQSIADLDALLADDSIEEIWINSPERVFIARDGRPSALESALQPDAISLWIERLLMFSQRRLDLSHPFVDATLRDGSRLHVTIPDVTQQHWAINIRKFMRRLNTLDDLVARRVLDRPTAVLLEAAAINGYNIIVAGGTGAGKTTMLNCLLDAIPDDERIITCEEVFELSVRQHDHVAMQTRAATLEGIGQVTVRELVRQSLRMRPQRLVVGEVREAESLDLLLALNSGQPGMATIHANSAREAILKLCTLPLLAGENVRSDFVVPTVAASIDLIVHVSRDHNGVRRLQEVVALTGRLADGQPEYTTLIKFDGKRWAVHSDVLPKQDVRGRRIDAVALWRAVV
ncbi:MAG: hypothetical protein RL441_1271 [Actinomycetota bacterium]